jgi:hypothetical protein
MKSAFPIEQDHPQSIIAVQQTIAAYASLGVSSLDSGRLRAVFF